MNAPQAPAPDASVEVIGKIPEPMLEHLRPFLRDHDLAKAQFELARQSLMHASLLVTRCEPGVEINFDTFELVRRKTPEATGDKPG